MSLIQLRLNIKSNDVSFTNMRRYTNIPLPDELAKRIDKVIKSAELGYKTKSEFVKEAVREKLITLTKFREFKKKEFW